MNRMTKLFGKPIEITLGDEKEVFKVYPIQVKDMDIFDRVKSKDEDIKMKALLDLLNTSLKEEEPLTMDEMLSMDVKLEDILVSAIMEINGLIDKVKNDKK